MSDHKAPLALATASLMEIIGKSQAYQAAIIQGRIEDAELLRREAHDMLDSYFDLNGQAAQAVKALLGS